MDDHIATALGVISNKKTADSHTVLPLCKLNIFIEFYDSRQACF